MSDPTAPIVDAEWRPSLVSRLLGRLRRARQPVPFDVAWDAVRNGDAPPLPRGVVPPAGLDGRMRLRAAYLAVPVLPRLHVLLPEVLVMADDAAGPDPTSAHGPVVRVDCGRPVDVVAFALLREFGRAVDRVVLEDRDRAALDHPEGVAGWRAGWLSPHERGEHWFAESFAHWWWPERLEAHRPSWALSAPPLAPALATSAFDLERLARRRSAWGR